MKLSVLTLLSVFILITSGFAQSKGNYIQLSSKITTETKNITGFDKIEVSEDFQVFIRFSDKAEKVEIEANENLHNFIQVKKVGKTLKISSKSYSTENGGAKERLIAYITAKQLIEIKGEEDVEFVLKEKLQTEELTINLEEDCKLEGHLEVQKLVVMLNEDSDIDIEGSAQTMTAEGNEDSTFHGYNFVVENLALELDEDSEAKLTVNGNIDLRADGDSYFYYRGDGNFIRKHLKDDSEVRSW